MKDEIKLTRKYLQRFGEIARKEGIGKAIAYDIWKTLIDIEHIVGIGLSTLERNIARDDYEKVALKQGKEWWSTQVDRYQSYINKQKFLRKLKRSRIESLLGYE